GLLAEVSRHRALERRSLAAAVLAAGRGRDRRDPDVVAAAPVTRDPAERREASVAAGGPDADAVDARPADDADSPAVLRPCAEHRERVVADRDPGRETSFAGGGLHLLHLGREVDAGEQKLSNLGHRS